MKYEDSPRIFRLSSRERCQAEFLKHQSVNSLCMQRENCF